MEAFIIALVLGDWCFYFRNDFAQPVLEDVMQGLIPTMPSEALYTAIGHWSNSDATQFTYTSWYKPGNSIDPKKELNRPEIQLHRLYNCFKPCFFCECRDSFILAAAFYKVGMHEVAEIQDAISFCSHC
jgi:manganese transport protein